LAAAVAKAGLEVILKENLSENSLKLGNIFYSELNRIFGSKSWVKEIRGGRGLYAGI
jgi:acetylornithine/succinyldiaminopimelate/putrescine aminotransferase